jgi:hypothetical protein
MMGNVIKLPNGRNRRRFANLKSPSLEGRDKASNPRRIYSLFRIMARLASHMGRVFAATLVGVLVTALVLFGRPVRFLLQIGVIAMLLTVALEYFHHWRDAHLALLAGGTFLLLLLIISLYESCLLFLYQLRQKLLEKRA